MKQYDPAPLADWIGAGRRPTTDETSEIRRCLLDTLACLAGGWNTDISRKAAYALRDKQNGMIAKAVRYGTAMHALDFDDSEVSGSTHPSAVLLAALLPLAEQLDASIDELVEAYLCGFETIAWFGRTFGYRHYEAGWHATATTGLFGAVAACAKLLGRNPAQILNGLSLASSYAGGLKRQVGSEGKALHVGMAAANALMIVPLISAGYQAGRDVWNGAEGYMALHHAEREDSLAASNMLGDRTAFSQEGVVRKAYPCCHYTHRLIEAALEFSKEIEIDRIGNIELEMPAGYASLVSGNFPDTAHEARFSAAFCVAAALHDGILDIRSFGKRAIGRRNLKLLMKKTTVSPYAVTCLSDLSPEAPDRLCVTMSDGTEHLREISHVPGSRAQPMDDDALRRKARQCFGLSRDEQQSERLIALALTKATTVRDVSMEFIGSQRVSDRSAGAA